MKQISDKNNDTFSLDAACYHRSINKYQIEIQNLAFLDMFEIEQLPQIKTHITLQ